MVSKDIKCNGLRYIFSIGPYHILWDFKIALNMSVDMVGLVKSGTFARNMRLLFTYIKNNLSLQNLWDTKSWF